MHASNQFLLRAPPHLPLHSAPTRRSSDLRVAPHPRGGWPSHGIDPAEPRQRRGRSSLPTVCPRQQGGPRSEEHASELQSPCNLVCRLLLEKKNWSRRPYVWPELPGSSSTE